MLTRPQPTRPRPQPTQGRHLTFEGAGGTISKEKEKKKEKKITEREKREKKKERKKGTMNNVKLLHIKCCFIKKFGPSRKS